MSAFSLKPYEDVIPGVRYRDGRLRLRPTWAATTLDLYGVVFGVFFTAAGIATRNIPVIAVGVVISALNLPYLRCHVVAEESTIRVVNKWSRSTFDVDDIAAVRVKEFRPSSFVPFRAPGTLWPRRLAACSLLMRDRTEVRCDALVGLPRTAGAEDPSPIEAKTAILERWIESASSAPAG